MRQQVSFLTQSRFYSPAFNAAIFDGPIRIYFAQYQESLALKIYFDSQNRLKDIYQQVREVFRKTGVNIFIMLYPSSEAFQMSFADGAHHSTDVDRSNVAVDRLGSDFVIGVNGPVDDAVLAKVYERVEEVARAVTETLAATPVESISQQL